MLSRCYRTEKHGGKETGCVVSNSLLFVDATRDEFAYDPSLHNLYCLNLLIAVGENVPKEVKRQEGSG